MSSPIDKKKRMNSQRWYKLRKKIQQRDRGICKKCGMDYYKLEKRRQKLVRKGEKIAARYLLSNHGFIQAFWTVDHIIPLHKGGNNQPDNLQTLCEKCHIEKTREENRASHTESR